MASATPLTKPTPFEETLILSHDPDVLVTPVNEFHRLEAATALTPKLPHPSATVGGGGVGQLSEGGAIRLSL